MDPQHSHPWITPQDIGLDSGFTHEMFIYKQEIKVR